MKISNFSEPQRQALLDLLVLAMYADGHLASAEDARVERLLSAMGRKPGYDQQREFDASVTRVRLHSLSPEATRAHLAELARHFTTQEDRRGVYDLLEDLMKSDNRVSVEESRFLAIAREVFQLAR